MVEDESATSGSWRRTLMIEHFCSLRYLNHVKIAVAVSGVEGFDPAQRSGNRIVGMAHPLAECCITHSIDFMQRLSVEESRAHCLSD